MNSRTSRTARRGESARSTKRWLLPSGLFFLFFWLGATAYADPPAGRWIRTQEDLIAYRVYGGEAGPTGSLVDHIPPDKGIYYTLTKPVYREGSRNSNALPPSNTALVYDVVRIKAGTEIYIGESAPQKWVGDRVPQRSGGGNEIQIRHRDVMSERVEVLKSAMKLTYGRNFAPQFDFEAQINRDRTFSDVWYNMRETKGHWDRDPKTGARTTWNYPTTSSRVVTDSSVVAKTASTYGKVPGGVLLEAKARFSDGTRLRSLAVDSSNLVINNACTYETGLSFEELAILWKHVYDSDDWEHFGAVSQHEFKGVPKNSIVALWLGLADSELGGYAYGYDIQGELFDSDFPGFLSAQLAELNKLARFDVDAMRKLYYLQIHALQPRLYLKTDSVEMSCKGGALSVTKHVANIHFQVFNEGPDGVATFTEIPPEQLSPEEGDAVKWTSKNLATIAARSPSMQRVLRYSEVLGLMRLGRQRDVLFENQESLRIAYKTRRRLSHRFDIYERVDGKRAGPRNRAEIRRAIGAVDARYRRIERDLSLHDRVIVLSNLLSLSWWLSSGDTPGSMVKRYLRELDDIVRRFGGGKGISSVQEGEIEAVKEWVSHQKGLE